MRPVLLTMEGFASFRDRTELDFRQVNYFALVGRTGAGKSTVIDAITFALYGTADRWGRDNAIRYALAPTANQAKVSLVFDAGGKRYVIAREVRRSGQAPPVQKSVSLELLADQNGLGLASEEPGNVLAGNPKDARRVVTQLLGVDFDEFCKCVVLPQGKFSEFMVSQPRERREILSRLLGEQRYQEMHQLAVRKAENATGQVNVLTAQLSQLDRSDAEIDDLHRHHRRLVDLAATVDQRVGELRGSTSDLRKRAAATEQLSADLSLLTLEVPEDVRHLDGLVAESQDELELAEREASRAHEAADAARSRQQAAPSADRARQFLKDRGRLDQLLIDRPQLEESHNRAAAEEFRLNAATREADAARETARSLQDERRCDHDAAAASLQTMRSETASLGALRAPAGLSDLAARLTQAAELVQDAEWAVDEADARLQQLREQGTDPSEIARLETQVSRLTALGPLEANMAALVQQEQALLEADEQAQSSRKEAASDLERLQTQLHELKLATTATGLRAELHVGDICPVCEQTVIEVPAFDGTADATSEALTEQIRDQQKRLRDLDAVAGDAQTALSRHQARREQAESKLGAEHADLDGVDEASVRRKIDHASSLAAELTAAGTVAGSARQNARAVLKAEGQLRDDEQTARRHLNNELRRLAALTTPAVDDSNLGHAWADLTAWAEQHLVELERRRPVAEKAAAEAESRQQAAEAGFQVAMQNAEAASVNSHQAGRAAAEAEQQHQRCAEEIARLRAELADAPDAVEAQRLLERATALEREATDHAEAAAAARVRLGRARAAVANLQERLGDARQQLSRSRDPLVRLGAPPLLGAGILADWTLLAGWAADEATVLRSRLALWEAELSGLRIRLKSEASRLAATLVEQGVQVPAEADVEQLTENVVTWVALAVDDASRAAISAVKDKEDRTRLAAELETVEELRAVAAELGRLLSPAQFGKWLTNTVMSRLVADASQTLFDLSRGQFSLSHDDKSEFVVIDHFDADSTRPVRTLSGGETFQASLALALALSAHMSALGAGGVSRLGSIFLDEGFGTLDPDALTVVADTLETLAEGDRLVGVVTHVDALAERIPHRFTVERDSRTSTIRQETA